MFLHIFKIHSFIILFITLITFSFIAIIKGFRISGIVIYLSSIAAYIISLFIKNLYLQFLAISIFIIYFLITIYYAVFYFYYKNKNIDYISLSDGIIHPFEKTELEIEAKNLPISFPGIFYMINLNVLEKNNIINQIIEPITYSKKDFFKFKTIFTKHGNFILNEFKFIIRDIFGLTEFRIKSNFSHTLVVYPYYLDSINIPFFLDKGGEEILQSIVRENSTDFFENRKYYPGDDTRRINWKVFAHSGELHIREVEKIPPKIGQISVLFAPYSKNIYEYEYITSIFLSTINFLLKYDLELKIIAPCSNNIFIINSNSEKDFNFIINNSYIPFENKKIELSNKPIVFASFEEFVRLLEYGMIDKNFSAITFFENIIKREDLIKILYKIENFDNLIKEAINHYNNFKIHKKRKIIFNEKKNLAESKNIELRIYRITDEHEKIFK